MTPVGAWVAVIVAVVGGLSGLGALIKTFLERPKLRADAMTLVNTAALETMASIKETAAATQTRLDEVERENERHEDRIGELEDRDDRHVRAMRLLVAYIAEMHSVFERGGLVPPPNPLSASDLDELLIRIKRTVKDGG